MQYLALSTQEQGTHVTVQGVYLVSGVHVATLQGVYLVSGVHVATVV